MTITVVQDATIDSGAFPSNITAGNSILRGLSWRSPPSVRTFTRQSASFSINPTSTGNFFLVEVICLSGTVTATSMSGGNCTWVQAAAPFTGSTNALTATIFIGTATSTGSSSATVSFSGSTPTVRISAQQFSSTHGAWTVDKTGHIDSAGTNTWASLTPVQTGELYFGYAYDSSTSTNGSTTGYTYFQDSNGNGTAYNPACTGAAQAPTWGDSGQEFGVMLLLKENGPAAITGGHLYQRAVPPVRAVVAHVAGPANAHGPSAVSVVQSTSQPCTNQNAVNFTLGSAPTPGNILVAFCSFSQYPSARTISPPSGSWHLIDNTTDNSGILHRGCLLVCGQGGDGTAWDFTLASSGGTDNSSGALYEITGASNSAPVNQHAAGSNSSSASFTTPSVTRR